MLDSRGLVAAGAKLEQPSLSFVTPPCKCRKLQAEWDMVQTLSGGIALFNTFHSRHAENTNLDQHTGILLAALRLPPHAKLDTLCRGHSLRGLCDSVCRRDEFAFGDSAQRPADLCAPPGQVPSAGAEYVRPAGVETCLDE